MIAGRVNEYQKHTDKKRSNGGQRYSNAGSSQTDKNIFIPLKHLILYCYRIFLCNNSLITNRIKYEIIKIFGIGRSYGFCC